MASDETPPPRLPDRDRDPMLSDRNNRQHVLHSRAGIYFFVQQGLAIGRLQEMERVVIVKRLSCAQKKFLLDPRPYVKGPYGHPVVRTMLSLEKLGAITTEGVYGSGLLCWEYKITEKGKLLLKEKP